MKAHWLLIVGLFLVTILARSGTVVWDAVTASGVVAEVRCDGRRTHQGQAMLAIVIDDLASATDGLQTMLALDVPLTFAVLPGRPDTRSAAEQVVAAGHEVILHLPMEAKSAKPSWYSGTPITTKLNDSQIKALVQGGFREVPWATGLNNHMGSLATEDQRVVGAILDLLRDEQKFVLDSRTSHKTVIPRMAAQKQVPCLQRSLFLDHVPGQAAVAKQLRLLGKLAQTRGSAIGIGHVGKTGPGTAAALAEVVPELKRQGIRFVTLSTLIQDSK